MAEDILLGKVFSQTLLPNFYYFFVIGVADPNGEKEIRGLGRGISDLRSLARIPNGYPRGITE